MTTLAWFACVGFATAQPAKLKPATAGDAMIRQALDARTDELSSRFLAGATTADEWRKVRPRLMREYYDMLGLWPLPEKTPLKAVVTRTFETQGAIVENLHFQSVPGLYVTANFYRPKHAKGKLPAVLYVCGHAGRGRDGCKSAYQDHPLWFANNGYACLIVDTLQLGEIAGIHHGTYKYDRAWWISAGYTPAGVEAWNGVRAIDYLLTRPEVDADRIGVTGISGGGAATFWIAAADERVKVAVPVSGMSDLESYVKNQVVNGHCDCMFLHNQYGWEWTTIAALVAPRPMLFANSDNDPIFPMDGNRRIIERLRKAYAMLGAADKVDDTVSVGGHAYRADLRVAIYRFLNKHLKGDASAPVQDAAFETIPGKDLRAFPDDLPADALNAKIDETFVPRAKPSLPEPGKFAEWKQAKLAELRERVFASIPAKVAPAKLTETTVKTDAHTTCTWIRTENPETMIGVIVVGSRNEAKDHKLGKSLPFLIPRGLDEGDRRWTRKSPPNTIERSLVLVGQTEDERRVFDVMATLAAQRASNPMLPRVVAGRGAMGVVAAYATLLSGEPLPVIHLDGPPSSHVSGPHFHSVLRVIDVPEALGLLAPTDLTIVSDDPAFQRTASIYRLAGAAGNLHIEAPRR